MEVFSSHATPAGLQIISHYIPIGNEQNAPIGILLNAVNPWAYADQGPVQSFSWDWSVSQLTEGYTAAPAELKYIRLCIEIDHQAMKAIITGKTTSAPSLPNSQYHKVQTSVLLQPIEVPEGYAARSRKANPTRASEWKWMLHVSAKVPDQEG